MRIEDVQDPETLTRNLNQFIGPAHQALSGGLTFADNFRAEWHTTEPLYVPDDWAEVTLAGDWVKYASTYPTLQVSKAADGRVYTRGMVKSATATSGTPVVQFPPEYLPDNRYAFATVASDAFGFVVLTADGMLEARTGTFSTYLSLNGLSWMARDRSPIPPACFPYDFATGFTSAPEAVILVGYEEHEPTFRPRASLGAVDWELVHLQGKPYVRVNNVPGLIPGRAYRLSFLVVDR